MRQQGIFFKVLVNLAWALSFLLLAAPSLYPQVDAGAIPGAVGDQSGGVVPSANSSVDADRWMLIDLYWFDRDNIGGSVHQFWERYAPLYRDVSGQRGVIIDIARLMDFVLNWRGDLNQRIPLPQNMEREKWVQEDGQLTGDTTERKRKWKERFATATTGVKPFLGQNWTYSDLKRLANQLRETAETNYNLKGMKIGSYADGEEFSQYEYYNYQGDKFYESTFSTTFFEAMHPNVFVVYPTQPELYFNPTAILAADPSPYGAFPKGIPAGTPIYDFFGAQWGSLSKAVGLDAIILGNGVIEHMAGGPFGRMAPPDPEKVAQWTTATANLVKATKLANPKAWVIGSSENRAVRDWRVACVDLEAIAKQGYLDAWIDETWSGAYNEVGVRDYTFWNFPLGGWTYQMSFVLLHAAMFSDTKVRHYTLVDTFDAWETWDTIHTAPERLEWAIWAYSHAAVKTPGGLKVPDGTYIACSNQGKRLLSEQDVAFLTDSLNQATFDARQTSEVFGPTLVYARQAMEWQSNHSPDQTIKEWIDEQAGTLMKWGVPIASVTRVEYLPFIRTDLPILQTPVHLSDKNTRAIAGLIESGQPVAIFGSPAGGIDPGLARLVGIETTDKTVGPVRDTALLQANSLGISDGIPNTFRLFQPFTSNKALNGAMPVYSVNGSPVLTVNAKEKEKVVFWDPPGYALQRANDEPLVDRLGSPYPYVLVARALSSFLKPTSSPYVENIAANSPVAIAGWQVKDGSYRLLVGNLEEGLSGDGADMSRHVTVTLPETWSLERRPLSLSDIWASRALGDAGKQLRVDLGQAECKLFGLKK